MDISRSFKLWCTKNKLLKKYAHQLYINTAESWNNQWRIIHSRILIDRGIEPTEENLQKFHLEVNTLANKPEVRYLLKPVPVVFRSSNIANTEKRYPYLEKVLNRGFPATNHSLFDESYDGYVGKFNSLAKILDNQGIDIKLLRETIDAARKLERLQFYEVFLLGLRSGIETVIDQPEIIENAVKRIPLDHNEVI
ncbi:hypothetical protein Dtox_3716 [Desulfofarcimen acetoxidans DSM 771]|uniref:Uncharacterized protein n=1 Tax=Desulfofarcimen acetoxidans (strain ATCC 49208 / DSM 771 / KCTC 5769 / VKM B-1644 / 5575) TaxID=485916 RepID=C8VWR0_DESAS|nr:hypothetical protein [Desulfofarcimen acetoxidans]ACV64424.1 hypothetical protein Dtox_3716 [Desulfofarcimen acetoxidans DSM 771]